MATEDALPESPGVPARDLDPHQIINQLWKRFEHLEPVLRRVRMVEEIKLLDLPQETLDRLVAEYS